MSGDQYPASNAIQPGVALLSRNPQTFTGATTFSNGTASTSPSTGTVIISGSGGLGVGGQATIGGLLFVDQATSAPTFTTATVAYQAKVTAPDATPANIVLESYGRSGNVVGAVASGTAASPGFPVVGTNIVALTAYGWTAANTWSNNAKLSVAALNAWSSGDHSTTIIFETTPSGSTSMGIVATLTSNLLIGTSTDITGTGGLCVAGTTASSSTSTGAFQCKGGGAFAGAVYAGGTINGGGTLYISGTAEVIGLAGFGTPPGTQAVSIGGTAGSNRLIAFQSSGNDLYYIGVGTDNNIRVEAASTNSVILNTSSTDRVTVNSSGQVLMTSTLNINGAAQSAQPTGFGTPTGVSRVSSFPGASATLAQCSGAIADLITVLKTYGFAGT